MLRKNVLFFFYPAYSKLMCLNQKTCFLINCIFRYIRSNYGIYFITKMLQLHSCTSTDLSIIFILL